MKTSIAVALVLTVTTRMAVAGPTVRIEPKTARPGDAVLVTVTDADGAPKGSADGSPLQFFRAKNGYQAVFAVPFDADADPIEIDIHGVKDRVVLPLKLVTFPETDIVVEEELANPDADARKVIDADNAAMLAAMRKHAAAPLFSQAFARPRGKVTSRFGEWRTFNEGHRSQHLGYDLFAKEGSSVKAVNAGVVTLVRETFLAGNVVVVSHGAGIASAYFHLREAKVAEGESVERGTEIGLVGQTGRTTGPHLHLSMRVPGGFVDPSTFFRLDIAPVPAPMRAARRAFAPWAR